MTGRRVRRAARVALLDPDGRVLLFRFTTGDYPPFWVMPGGECEPGEDFPQAASRELREETGIAASPAPLSIVKEAKYTYLGEPVKSVEHFFLWRAETTRIDTSGHTDIEQKIMREHRWFSRAELLEFDEQFYPADLPDILAALDQQAGAEP
ncbi:MAG: NUDIX domain-containing protein [Novosphingobium sp.]|nr:NUDIX domain-containing protein [Novosphingobium sp.]